MAESNVGLRSAARLRNRESSTAWYLVFGADMPRQNSSPLFDVRMPCIREAQDKSRQPNLLVLQSQVESGFTKWDLLLDDLYNPFLGPAKCLSIDDLEREPHNLRDFLAAARRAGYRLLLRQIHQIRGLVRIDSLTELDAWARCLWIACGYLPKAAGECEFRSENGTLNDEDIIEYLRWASVEFSLHGCSINQRLRDRFTSRIRALQITCFDEPRLVWSPRQLQRVLSDIWMHMRQVSKEWRVAGELPHKPERTVDYVAAQRSLDSVIEWCEESSLRVTSNTPKQQRANRTDAWKHVDGSAEKGTASREMEAAEPTEIPRWDSENGLLWLGKRVIREVRRYANSTIIPILDAFEKSGWRNDIDNPPQLRDDPVKLAAAIRSLNKGLDGIRFGGNGRGTGIIWKRIASS